MCKFCVLFYITLMQAMQFRWFLHSIPCKHYNQIKIEQTAVDLCHKKTFSHSVKNQILLSFTQRLVILCNTKVLLIHVFLHPLQVKSKKKQN